MSQPVVPGDGRGRHGPTNGISSAVSGLAPGKAQPSERESRLVDRANTASNAALICLVTVLLTFVLVSVTLDSLTIAQALQVDLVVTAIGLAAIHGRAMLKAFGRRLLGDLNARREP